MGDRTFEARMRRLVRLRRMRPLLRYRGRAYYSPLHIVAFHSGEWFDDRRSKEFEALIALVHEVQDFYVPEARSNGRIALWVESRGFFNRMLSYPVTTVRERRRELLASGRLDLLALLSKHGLTTDAIRWWRLQFASTNRGLDPLREWSDLVEKVAYAERQKLRFDALLAQDYREFGTILVLILRDLGAMKPYEEFDDVFDCSDRDPESGAPIWRVAKFGQEHLGDHFYQLELIVNDYDINPKPRGIVFTEGDEWKAIEILFRARGFDPKVLGIEFRSIHSIGNFNFHHWRAFLEYMQEKQVLVYFAIDSERKDLQLQIEKFITTPRLTRIEGLKKVVPTRERICVWDKSFEESNFTDEEIAAAFTRLGRQLTTEEVGRERVDPHRTKGLAKALLETHGPLSKPELDIELVAQLLARTDMRKELRPVEAFVGDAGQAIALNHQPSHADTIAFNRRSGFLG